MWVLLFVKKKIPTISGDEFHGEIYDAIWTMALALKELQLDYDSQPGKEKPSLASFNYTRKDMAEQLMTKISALRFQGASGLVSFSGADRIGTTALFQIQSLYANRCRVTLDQSIRPFSSFSLPNDRGRG